MNKQNLEIPDLPGISLVAYYRNKPDNLNLLISEVQQQLQSIYGKDFIPSDLAQIHGTIIGCEGLSTPEGIVNKWFYQHRNELKYADLSGFLEYFANTLLLPLTIQFGGYQKDDNYQFLSRGKHPGDRSFQLQKSSNNQLIPIIIGWPITKQKITTDLNQIRYDCQQYNFLHKYHQFSQNIDNDFYLRLGTITSQLSIAENLLAETSIINYLQKRLPILIELSYQDLSLVKYNDLLLFLNSTEYYNLKRINISADFINYLYQ